MREIIKLTDNERKVIKHHQSGCHVYEIELCVSLPQDYIEKVLYMYDRLTESNIRME